MQQYLDVLQDCLTRGVLLENRTDTPALTIPSAVMHFDLAAGHPAVTTKKLAFGASVGEMLGFIRGYSSAADFRKLGCHFWDQNANENKQWLANPYRKGTDDLGRVYGVQWRDWAKYRKIHPQEDEAAAGFYERESIDQLHEVLKLIYYNPENRRIILNSWRPDEFDQMALPPCHVAYEFVVIDDVLHMTLWQRSADLFLGVPMNINGAALLQSMVARVSGLQPGTFTHFLSCPHIYENHIAQVKEQLTRRPKTPLPTLNLNLAYQPDPESALKRLETLTPEEIWLDGYFYHPALKAPMAV